MSLQLGVMSSNTAELSIFVMVRTTRIDLPRRRPVADRTSSLSLILFPSSVEHHFLLGLLLSLVLELMYIVIGRSTDGSSQMMHDVLQGVGPLDLSDLTVPSSTWVELFLGVSISRTPTILLVGS